jgi:hypothetical protein
MVTVIIKTRVSLRYQDIVNGLSCWPLSEWRMEKRIGSKQVEPADLHKR